MTKRGWLLLIAISSVMLGLLLPATAADKTAPLVAVLPFDDGSIKERWWGNHWDVGKGIADMMITELLAQKKFRLVEREQINKIIEEQNFGASGRVDTKSAAKIGKILGVKYVIIGRVTEFSIDTKAGAIGGLGGIRVSTARVALDGRLVDTTTAEIISGVTGKGESKSTGVVVATAKLPLMAFGAKDFQETILGKATRAAIAEFSAKLTADVFGSGATAGGGSLKLEGKVAAVSGSKVYLNIGSKDGVTVGMVFSIEHIVEEVRDPDTNEVIDMITEPVCEVTISEVKEASSSGSISSGGGTPQKGDLAKQK